MWNSKWHAKILSIALAAEVLISGCCLQQRSGGTILVDDPEIFTRERLVQQRVEERAWLQRKLDEPFSSGFQGIRDARLLQGLMIRGEASFDPLGGVRNELAQTQLQSQLAQAQSEQLRAENELARLRQAGTNTPAPTSPGQTQPQGGGGGQPQNNQTNNSYSTPPTGSSFFADTQNQTKFPALPQGSNASITSAQLSGEQRLNDEAAYRANIRARMLEQDLDDTHDLFGRTLYTLKFDITVVGGDNADALARIHCKLSEGGALTGNLLQTLYDGWVGQLRERMAAESIDLEARAALNKLTNEEQLQLAIFATHRLNSGKLEDELRPTVKSFLPFAGLGTWPLKPLEPQDSKIDLQVKTLYQAVAKGDLTRSPLLPALIADFVGRSYTQRLVGIVEPSGTRKVDVGGSAYLIPLVAAMSPVPDAFRGKIASAHNQIQVYSVEPKELAQNISDVAAREDILNLAGALGAALPQSGVGLKAYAEYIRRSQEFMQGILRKPVIVGYPDGADSFGWMIGPGLPPKS